MSPMLCELTKRRSIVHDCLCTIRPISRPYNEIRRAILGSNHVGSQTRGWSNGLNAELCHILLCTQKVDCSLSLIGILQPDKCYAISGGLIGGYPIIVQVLVYAAWSMIRNSLRKCCIAMVARNDNFG